MANPANLHVEKQYESVTRLARSGDWPRSTDEIEGPTPFADGVIDDQIVHFYPRRNSHVKSHGWTFYEGTRTSEYDYYIVCSKLPQEWTAFGCNGPDFRDILTSFEQNPFMIKRGEL